MPETFRKSPLTAPLYLMMRRDAASRAHPLIAYGAAIAGIAVAWGVRLLADPALGSGFPYVTFFPAIVLVAFFFGARAGCLAAVLGGLVSWYAFIEPRGTFALSPATAVALGFYAFVVGVDLILIHWTQVATRRLSNEMDLTARLARQRALLFDELQHRVGNNLQVVAALISAQRRAILDEDARASLEQAANRVTVIGRISRQLYQADGQVVSVGALLRELGRDVLDAHGRTHDIDLRYQIDDMIDLPREAAMPLALAFTEAMANVCEHALPVGGGGVVDVRFARAQASDGGGMAELVIADNGKGLPAGFVLDQAASLGLKIVPQLARQLGGEFTLAPGGAGGAVARISIRT